MPFKSYEQMAYLKHNEPEVYRQWVKKYGKHIVDGQKKKPKRKNLLNR